MVVSNRLRMLTLAIAMPSNIILIAKDHTLSC
jgi:hypothetical protein